MKKVWVMICLIMLICIFGVTSTAQESDMAFTDVSEGDWYHEDLVYSLENGLIEGFSDNTFRGEKTLTRAEFVTILGRIEDAGGYQTQRISDVPEGHWAYPYISWAVSEGITNGVGEAADGLRFAPDSQLTREQLAVFTLRYLRAKGITNDMIPADRDLIIADYASVSPWAYSDMIVYSRAGLLVGADGCMTRDRRIISCPREAITRAEADAVLAWIHRYLTGQVDTPRHQKMNCDLAAATETIEVRSEEKSASPEDDPVTDPIEEEPVSPEQDGNQAAAADEDPVAEERDGSGEPEVSVPEPPSPDRASHVRFETLGFSSEEEAREAKDRGREILASLIPQEVLDKFSEDGWLFAICTDEEYDRVSGRAVSIGVLKTQDKVIYIRSGGNNPATYAHELGHFVDLAVHGGFGGEETVDLYGRYKEAIGEVVVGKYNPAFIRMGHFTAEDYETRGANYAMSDPGECFAESFCQYCIHPEQLLEGCPEYYAYIEHCLNEI